MTGNVREGEQSLDEIVQELGAMIDANFVGGSKPGVMFLDSMPSAAEFFKKSELHARIYGRENFAVPALLRYPQQYVGKSWPYRHRFRGGPLPETLGEADPMRYVTNEEAQRHYLIRARQCPHPFLRAKYADLAARSGQGKPKVEAARLAIQTAIEAFPLVFMENTDDDAAKLLLQALELSLSFGFSEDRQRVLEVVKSAISDGMDCGRARTTVLIYGVAAMDKKRQLIDYTAIADQYELQANAIKAMNKEDRRKAIGIGSPFGIAFGMAELTRDRQRIHRVGKLDAEAWLNVARERSAEGETAFNVRQLLFIAKKVIDQLTDVDDLRSKWKREIQLNGEKLDGDLTEHTISHELTDEEIERLKKMRASLLERGDGWPEYAAMLIWCHVPTRAECEQQPKSVFDGLFAVMKIDGRRATVSDGSEWEHTASQIISILVQNFWNSVLFDVIRELADGGHFTNQVLLAPFIARKVPLNEMQMLASACDSLLTPDYIAASQQWILLVERLLRRIVEALGGSTTSARPDSQDDLESVFDSAVSELFRVIAQDEEHKEIGERLCNLLLFLFSWREAGWNWRNKVAHGLMEPKELNVFTAIHAYLACVCLISLVDTKSSSGEERSDRDAAQST